MALILQQEMVYPSNVASEQANIKNKDQGTAEARTGR